MPKQSSPKSLPRVKKTELVRADFKEAKDESSRERARTIWVIIFAFVLLVAFGVVVWAVLSGRSDGKIHSGNLDKIKSTSEERSSEE